MEKSIFNEAKSILEEIKKIEKKQALLKSYGKREDDKEYNDCLYTAYDTLDVLRLKWEKKFKEL